MAQIFPKSSNTVVRVAIAACALGLCGAGWASYTVWWSPYMTMVGVPLHQPVPFSHQHHVAGLGIDCRYCHTGVESSHFAGVPPTETCMTCHSQLWREAPLLEPIRASLRNDQPMLWNRVNDLPDFVYFNHSVHVQHGVGCSSCHGEVDRMPLTYRSQSLYMKWCLDCHRQPEKALRPEREIYNTEWKTPPDQAAQGPALLHHYGINKEQLMDCSTCHR